MKLVYWVFGKLLPDLAVHFDMAELNMPRRATGEIGGDVSVEIRRGRL